MSPEERIWARRMDDERIAKLETTVEMWMDSTTEYRKALCNKLDRVMDKIDSLPCPARQEITKGIHTQLKGLWILVSAIILGIIADWVRLK